MNIIRTCCSNPIEGCFRDRICGTIQEDYATHVLCVFVNQFFYCQIRPPYF
ncbi:DUF2237 family protein [Eudoraea sp.]|uniref:DUF2237 family protein n=1 Tax=Eudoraea sp. TaxID=1979955 RepID=UPI003C737C8E